MSSAPWDELSPAGATRVELYDTTLRDGSQGEGICFSVDDKLRITALLDRLGVAYIEGGWPGSNPKDAEYYERVKSLDLRHAKLTAFGMTCRVGVSPAHDTSVMALLKAETPVVTIVGKSSLFQVREVLRTSPEENLRLISETVRFLHQHGREVVYDAEHFFDGFKESAEYAISSLRAASEAGARCVVLCDTNGGSMPWEVSEAVQRIRSELGAVKVGIHTHNDSELAVANTVAAVLAGASHVQGTINGYGERCGNANLCSLAPCLELKMGYRCLPEGALARLTQLSQAVAEIANLAPAKNAAYVGQSAFAHKGGMHAAAMRRHPDSYQHVTPELLGNRSRILVSDLAGQGNMLSKAEELCLRLDREGAVEVVKQIKELESCGYQFEGAEASVGVLMSRRQCGYSPPFQLESLRVVVDNYARTDTTSEATVKLTVDGQVRHIVAEGQGPVDALAAALRKALLPVYPQLEEFRLSDYKVRILDGENGTAAVTRVLVDFWCGERCHTTVGASSNIIEASCQALKDALEFSLMEVGYASQVLPIAG